jgi:hypothetical protein
MVKQSNQLHDSPFKLLVTYSKHKSHRPKAKKMTTYHHLTFPKFKEATRKTHSRSQSKLKEVLSKRRTLMATTHIIQEELQEKRRTFWRIRELVRLWVKGEAILMDTLLDK